MLTYTCTVIGYLWKKFPESISKFDFNMLTYTCTVIVCSFFGQHTNCCRKGVYL